MTEMTGHDAEIGGHVGPKYAQKSLDDAAAKKSLYIEAINRHSLQQQEITALYHENKLLERDNFRLIEELKNLTDRSENNKSAEIRKSGLSQSTQ